MPRDIRANSQKTETSLEERFKTARTALAQVDPFYASESFWEAFLAHGLDEVKVVKVEAMLKPYRRTDAKVQSAAPSADDPVAQLLADYDSGVIETVQDLADAAEILAADTDNQVLSDAIQVFCRFQEEDRALAGRADWDEAEMALIAVIRQAQSASSGLLD